MRALAVMISMLYKSCITHAAVSAQCAKQDSLVVVSHDNAHAATCAWLMCLAGLLCRRSTSDTCSGLTHVAKTSCCILDSPHVMCCVFVLQTFEPRQVSNCLWAIATLRDRHTPLTSHIDRCILEVSRVLLSCRLP